MILGRLQSSSIAATSRVPGQHGIRFKIVLEGREEVSENRDTPGFAQQSLPARATKIGHVRVVVRESKQPAVGNTRSGNGV